MQVAIIYHSGFGHTLIVAEEIKKGILETGVNVTLVDAESAITNTELLNEVDTLVFGSPTYFGNVSAEFKKFMEATGTIWYKQLWRNKLAAGFTHSSTLSGDKFRTLNSLFLFAAQHSMLWIPLGIMPQHDKHTGLQLPEPNGLGSYMGLMTYSGNDAAGFNQPLDLKTAFAFGKRIGELTRKHNFLNKQSINN
jgi:multimeric flavodoxin WrbA